MDEGDDGGDGDGVMVLVMVRVVVGSGLRVKGHDMRTP